MQNITPGWKLSIPFGFLGFFATPAAVLLIAWLLFYLEIAPHMFSFVPAVYIAAGAFFGCMSYVPGAVYTKMYLTEMIYLTMGLVFGWMTIAFKTWYTTRQNSMNQTGTS